MSKAFKCDKCGKFEEGSPNKIEWGYTKSNGYGGREDMEVCWECRKSFMSMVESW